MSTSDPDHPFTVAVAHTEPGSPMRTPYLLPWPASERAFLGWDGEIQGAPDAGTLAWACGASFSPESQGAAPGGALCCLDVDAGTTVGVHGLGASGKPRRSLLFLLTKVSVGPACSQGNAINIHSFLIDFFYLNCF